jgi:thiamine pyrophosphate-dependent acetolactate synthase large subunit-like protein
MLVLAPADGGFLMSLPELDSFIAAALSAIVMICNDPSTEPRSTSTAQSGPDLKANPDPRVDVSEVARAL